MKARDKANQLRAADDSHCSHGVGRSNSVSTPVLEHATNQAAIARLTIVELLALDSLRWSYEVTVVPGPDLIH